MAAQADTTRRRHEKARALYERWRGHVRENSRTGFMPSPWERITDAERTAWEKITP